MWMMKQFSRLFKTRLRKHSGTAPGTPFKETVEEAGQNPNEAKNKVNSAANEIYQNADRVSADWRLPPAVVSGLPGGLTVTLNYEDPELVGRVIRALAAPQESGTGVLTPMSTPAPIFPLVYQPAGVRPLRRMVPRSARETMPAPGSRSDTRPPYSIVYCRELGDLLLVSNPKC